MLLLLPCVFESLVSRRDSESKSSERPQTKPALSAASVAADVVGEEDDLEVVRVVHVLAPALVPGLHPRVHAHHLAVAPVLQLQAPLVIGNHLRNR